MNWNLLVREKERKRETGKKRGGERIKEKYCTYFQRFIAVNALLNSLLVARTGFSRVLNVHMEII